MSANFLLCFSPHTVNDPLNSPHCCSEAAQSSKSHMNAFWEVKEAISFTNTFAFTMRCSFNVFFVCAPISSEAEESSSVASDCAASARGLQASGGGAEFG